MNKNYFLFFFLNFITFIYSQNTNEYKHFILYGQSFSTGNQSYPSISTDNVAGNYMIGDQVWITNFNNGLSEFTPLISTLAKRYLTEPKNTDSQTFGESPVVGLTNHIQLKETQSGSSKVNYIATAAGEGAQSIESLSKRYRFWWKEYYYYNYFKNALDRAALAAKNNNYKISSPAIFWMQGEYNYTGQYDLISNKYSSATTDKNTYKRLMVELKEDMQNEIKAAYGQLENPVFITYQAGHIEELDNLQIGMAQLEASNAYPDIFCAGPTYYLPHRGIHLEPNGYRWFGEMLGKVYYKTQILKEDFKPLQPKSIIRNSANNEIIINFHVPKPPMVFDTNILEELPSYGFKVKRNGYYLPITKSNIRISGNSVIISGLDLSENINVLYGVESRYYPNNGGFYAKGGNLRDSDDYKSFYTYIDLDTYTDRVGSLRPRVEPKNPDGTPMYGKNYPLYNFSLAFDYLLKDNQSIKIVPGFSNIDILYVKKGSTGDGSSWANALGKLSDAIEIARDNSNIKQIWVAKGTYIPLTRENGNIRHRMYLIPKDVHIYGGFSGNEVSLSQRDWRLNETILSGDINGDDIGLMNNSDNTYHVVVVAGDVGNAILDGFTIIGGNANNMTPGWPNIMINNSAVVDNSGGAIQVVDSPGMTFKNLRIKDSQGYSAGGAIRHAGSTVTYENISITNGKNFGNLYGGGAMLNFASDITITNGLIADNISNTQGGGIFNENSKIKLTNVSLISNTANYAKGIFNDSNSSSQIYNSIIWNNDIVDNSNNKGQVYYSVIEGVTQKDANGNIAGDKVLTFQDVAAKDYRLTPKSFVINKGNNAYINTSEDLDGETRIVAGQIDLGAYEYPKEENCLWEIIFDTDTVTYDGQKHEILAKNTPTSNNVKISYLYKGINNTNYTETAEPPINVGDYEVQAIVTNTVLGCKDIYITNLIIQKAPFPTAGIEFKDRTELYNTQEIALEATGFPADATLTYSEDYKATDAGVYKGKVTITHPNYQDLIMEATLTINKAPVTITVNQKDFVFDGNSKKIDVTLDNNESSIDTLPEYTNAGTYPITINVPESKNYLSKVLLVDMIIDKAVLTTIKFEDKTERYNTQEQTLNAIGYPAGATVTYSGDYKATDAGVYKGKVTITHQNYQDVIMEATLTIEKAPVTITVNQKDFVFDGNSKKIDVTLDNNESSIDTLPEYINVGSYPITINVPESKNYLSNSQTVTMVIDKAVLTNVKFEDKTVTYNTKEFTLDAIGHPAGATVIYSGDYKATDAGVYKGKVTITHQNYQDLIIEATLTINKAPVIITVNQKDFVFDGNPKKVDVTLDNNESSIDTLPEYTNAGTYPITINVPESKNYLSKVLLVDMIIDKIPFPTAGIEFKDRTELYNTQEIALEATGFPADATATYSEDYKATDAGVYKGKVTITHQNYQDLIMEATLTINKAPVTITVNQKDFVFDGNSKKIDVTLDNNESSIDTLPEYTNAGTYPITINVPESKNYLSKVLLVDMIIDKAVLTTIKFEDKTERYNTQEQTLNAIGYPAGATVTYSGDYKATDAGVYKGKVTITHQNYQDVIMEATLTIEKAPVTITVNQKDFVFDGNSKKLM